MKYYGIVLRDVRKRVGLTQKKLAEMAHISVRKLQDIENHSADTKVSVLKSLCEVLNLPFYALFRQDFATAREFAGVHSPSLDKIVRPVEVICSCGEIVYSNPKALKLRGAHSFEVLDGTKIWEHHRPADRNRMLKHIEEIQIRPIEPYPFFGHLQKSDGSGEVSLRVDWDYIHSSEKKILGFLCLLES